MAQPVVVEPFTTIPETIDTEIMRLLRLTPSAEIGRWLHDAIRASGHLSTNDDLRWRLLSMIWLAAEYDIEVVWPYLMWFNQNAPVMSDHLTEILAEALDDFQAHLRMAKWQAEAEDERLVTFLSEFQNTPLPYKMAESFAALLLQADEPGLSLWLANFCSQTADQVSPAIRPWHLFAATWYATCFDPQHGITYLRRFSDDGITLSSAANATLMDLGTRLNCMPDIIQWIAACANPTVKQMFKAFGHPDLTTVVAEIFAAEPTYARLAQTADQAAQDVAIFKRNQALLAKAGITKGHHILDLACSLLIPQTLLFHSSGYQITGVDLEIPPAYLPLSTFKQRLKRGKYVKAWRTVTAAYYNALSATAQNDLKWRNLKVNLADLTRLHFEAQHFDAVLCCNHLQHAPDVEQLLAEIARILKPDGLLLADLKPYPSFQGAFSLATDEPWAHLRSDVKPLPLSSLVLNKWCEDQYQAALKRYFTLEAWETSQDKIAADQLTDDLRATLSDYKAAELTRQIVVILARKQ